MIPIDKVKKIIERYISLEKELSTGRVEPKLLAKKSKEYSDLKNIVPCAKEYIEFEKIIAFILIWIGVAIFIYDVIKKKIT